MIESQPWGSREKGSNSSSMDEVEGRWWWGLPKICGEGRTGAGLATRGSSHKAERTGTNPSVETARSARGWVRRVRQRRERVERGRVDEENRQVQGREQPELP